MKKLFPLLVFSVLAFSLGCVRDDAAAPSPSTTVAAAAVTGEKRETASTTAVETRFSATSVPAIVEMPEEVTANCIGFLVGAADEIASITGGGGGWVRPHPGPFAWEWIEKKQGSFDFTETDEFVKSAQKNRVGVLATVWPYAGWDQNACHKSECEVGERDVFYPRAKGGWKEFGRGFKKLPGIDYLKGALKGGGDSEGGMDGIPSKRCRPCDMGAYKKFMTALVERYDGDGVDDMPGLLMPVLYYEILNEPSMQGGDLTFFLGTPGEYVEILKASHEAIKGACGKCVVVQGGASGSHKEPTVFWSEAFRLGAGDFMDVANIHFINFGDASTLNVVDFERIMGENNVVKPVWVTESEFNSMGEVDAAVSGALSAGAQKIFFTGFGAGHGPLNKARQYESLYKKQVAKCR